MKFGYRCFLMVLAVSTAVLFSGAGAIEGTGEANVMTTADLGGFNRPYAVAASYTALVKEQVEARKFDEYGKIRAADENARLDNFAIEIKADPTVQGYLIVYGGRRSKAGEAKKAAARAKTYLVKKRRLNAKQLVTVDGGYREEAATELWFVPSGAQPPQATPTLDPSEVMPAKPAKRAKSKKPLKRKA